MITLGHTRTPHRGEQEVIYEEHERAFFKAVDRFRRAERCLFPALTDLLDIARAVGWQHEDDAALYRVQFVERRCYPSGSQATREVGEPVWFLSEEGQMDPREVAARVLLAGAGPSVDWQEVTVERVS